MTTETADASQEGSAILIADETGQGTVEMDGVSESSITEPAGEAPPETAGIFDLLPEVPADMAPDIAEVVKLAHSGVSEDVQLAFVEASRSTLQPTADEIVYLQDVGVSPEVVSAMIRTSSKNAEAAQTETGASEPVPETVEATEPLDAPNATEVTAGMEPQSEPAPVISSAPERVNTFYDELSPYGHWIEVDGYGWCWKPSVAVVDVRWQPYQNRGRWLHSDLGWYWQSDYNWGWVAFHYGRWFSDPVYGWCWYPDDVWAPSWVTWRTSGAYVGWAPLPPYSWYRPGVGFIYRNRHVSFSFGFGLSYSSYSWCGYRNLCRPNVYRYCEPRSRHGYHHGHSTVVNNYVIGDNNVIINNGVHIDRVNTASGEHVKQVNVRRGDGHRGRPDQVYSHGDESIVLAQRIEDSPSRRGRAFKSVSSGRGRSLGISTASTSAPSDARKSIGSRTGGSGVTKPASVRTPSSTRLADSTGSRFTATGVNRSRDTPAQKPSAQSRRSTTRTDFSSASSSRAGTTVLNGDDSSLRNNQFQSQTKNVQSRDRSRETTTSSRTVSSFPSRFTTSPAPGSRHVTTTSRKTTPSPVIVSPSGASSNSRFPKPTIISPDRNRSLQNRATTSRSTARSLPSTSRPSSSISTSGRSIRNNSRSSSSGSTSSPRISSTPSSSSTTFKSAQSRGSSRSSVQTRRTTQPSSRSSGASTQRKSVQSRSR